MFMLWGFCDVWSSKTYKSYWTSNLQTKSRKNGNTRIDQTRHNSVIHCLFFKCVRKYFEHGTIEKAWFSKKEKGKKLPLKEYIRCSTFTPYFFYATKIYQEIVISKYGNQLFFLFLLKIMSTKVYTISPIIAYF